MVSRHLQKAIDEGLSIRDIFEEGKKMASVHGADQIFNFTIGNPNVAPPLKIKEVLADLIAQEPPALLHGYPANAGFEDVRRHIAAYLNQRFQCSYEADGIYMSSGAAAAISILCNLLLDEGDEVVTFAPYFWEYKNYVETFQAKLVPVLGNPKTMQPDAEVFRSVITEHTKAVLINSPNNPTGVIYSEETVRAVATVLAEKEQEYGHPIYLISDEPYREIAFEKTVPYLTHYYKDTIVVYSYSKTLSIPGERIGYIALEPCVEGYRGIVEGLPPAARYLGHVNAPTLQQRLLLKCTGFTVDVDIYRKNRDVLYNGLTEMGYTCIHPDGAFYLFLKALEEDDVHFCEMAKEEKILLAPGSAFGGAGWVRVSYCMQAEKIEKSLMAFDRLYRKYCS